MGMCVVRCRAFDEHYTLAKPWKWLRMRTSTQEEFFTHIDQITASWGTITFSPSSHTLPFITLKQHVTWTWVDTSVGWVPPVFSFISALCCRWQIHPESGYTSGENCSFVAKTIGYSHCIKIAFGQCCKQIRSVNWCQVLLLGIYIYIYLASRSRSIAF
jgi:hypothetical protein